MTGAPATTQSRQIVNRLQANTGWLVLPSWIGSVLFHALLATSIIILAQLPSCRRDMEGEGGDSFRKVGIRVLPAEPKDVPSESPIDAPTETQQPEMASTAATDAPPEMDSPPVSLNLPQMPKSPAIIGAGALPAPPSVNLDSLIKPANPGKLTPGGGAPAGGGTSFLGIEDVGKRFVYVIDRSFSMANDHALKAAKLELLASLQRLDETQQFQIIFYNTEYVILDTRGGKYDVFWGTDAQRLKVSEQIRGISPAAGTRHLPAIMEALKFNPDVIFLLTDGAAESALSIGDLAQIERRNRNGARIHCIEFGRGVKSSLGEAGNFLKVLAKENDGKYVYRNVKGGFGE